MSIEQDFQKARGSAPKERKEIYVGPPIRAALKRSTESLSTVLNRIVDRYLGIISRANVSITMREEDVYRGAYEEMRKPVTADDIANFAWYVRAWLNRNPGYPENALLRLERLDYPDIVAIIERVENHR
jgi:hypothetical protein